MPVSIFTKEIVDADKPSPVVNIPPVRFIVGPIKQGRTCNIKGVCDLEISVSVISAVGIPVEEDLDDIGMKTRNVVIHMECDGEVSWVKYLG